VALCLTIGSAHPLVELFKDHAAVPIARARLTAFPSHNRQKSSIARQRERGHLSDDRQATPLHYRLHGDPDVL